MRYSIWGHSLSPRPRLRNPRQGLVSLTTTRHSIRQISDVIVSDAIVSSTSPLPWERAVSTRTHPRASAACTLAVCPLLHKSGYGLYAADSTTPYPLDITEEEVKNAVDAADFVLLVGSLKSDFNTGEFSYKMKPQEMVELHSEHTLVQFASAFFSQLSRPFRHQTDLDLQSVSWSLLPHATSHSHPHTQAQDRSGDPSARRSRPRRPRRRRRRPHQAGRFLATLVFCF